ncbi:hypothetical protein COLO4_37979 [Corchorus olitorius]|uniref:Rapid ALkalinization Factor n=1 Tax=Corchorus olitorius TaxID=93759 RepID=A0A1R3FXR1_9ROSI|nr:hypothetical protein COLO4_37979 [Corchorus olitorius]
MGIEKKKGELMVILVVMMLMLGLKAKCYRGAVIVKSNATYECKSNGRLDDCRIAQDLELELDMLMINSNVFRVLQDSADDVYFTNDAGQVLCPKDKGKPKGKCLPENKGPVPDNGGTYHR